MDNVVPIEDLAAVVENTILEIQKGVAAARSKGGIIVDLPKEVQFTVTVVKAWQALEISGGQTAETTEEQGGGSREVTVGHEEGLQSSTGTEQRSESGTRDSAGRETTTGIEKGTTNEQRTGKENSTVKDVVTRSGSEISQQDNAHNQQDTETLTYTD